MIGKINMTKATRCAICDETILNGQIVCAECKKEIFQNSWMLECDCSEDNCMTICRDCCIDAKIKEKWKMVLEMMIQEG